MKDTKAGTEGFCSGLGVKARASLLQGPWWFCLQNGAKNQIGRAHV